MRRRALLVPLFPIGLLLAPVLFAENWPQWRGPRNDGTSYETGIVSQWGPDENVRWRLPLPGPAGSTPVVWEDRILLTSTDTDSDALLVLAVGTDGKELWRRTVDQGALKVFEQFAHEVTTASPSPTTDGKHVWALFGTTALVAFDLDGKKAWQRNLAEDYGMPNMYFGYAASPLLHEGKLYLHFLHTDRQTVLALDAASGKTVWEHERKTDAEKECLHSYASPVLYTPEGGPHQLLIHGADYITGHDLSNGRELWRHGGLNPKDNYNPSFRLVATPVAVDDVIIVPSAKRGPVYALRPRKGTGKLDNSERVFWKVERGTPDVPSPLLVDDLVYLSGENGRLTALDSSTGEEVYAVRVHQSPHRGSPIFADGKVFLSGTDGTVSVVRFGREYELISQNSIDERLAASPAIAGGVIYLRSNDALWAIAPPSQEPTETTQGR